MAYSKIKKDGKLAKETNPLNKTKRSDAKVSLPEFIQKTNDYIKWCEEKNKPPLLTELSLLLGINRDTLLNYRQKPAYAAIIKRIDQMSENYWITRGNDGNKPLFSMFMLKAKHGYVEAQYQKVDMHISGLGNVVMPAKKPKIMA